MEFPLREKEAVVGQLTKLGSVTRSIGEQVWDAGGLVSFGAGWLPISS